MKLRRLSMVVLLGAAIAQAQSIHTPKPGSPERQAICDAARAFVLGKYAERPIPQAIVFKVGHLAVSGGYANLEAVPLLKDGRYAAPEYLPDIGFNFCLRSSGGEWTVVADLSRSDVPDAAQLSAIKQRLRDFPHELLSADWQSLLGR
jgi:hypothetical protein